MYYYDLPGSIKESWPRGLIIWCHNILIICDMVVIAPSFSLWSNFCIHKKRYPRLAAGLRFWRVWPITVNAYHHAALIVYYCGIRMCGTVIQQLFNGLRCCLVAPSLVHRNFFQGHHHWYSTSLSSYRNVPKINWMRFFFTLLVEVMCPLRVLFVVFPIDWLLPFMWWMFWPLCWFVLVFM